MVNFRYHIISIVAVFLALGVGVVMGSAVIDRAVVGTLREQQAAIDRRIDEVLQENDELRGEVVQLRQTSQQLADEASQRLLTQELSGTPVVVVTLDGAGSTAVEDVLQLLRTANADYQGTVALTERLTVADEEQRRDLARALAAPEGLPASDLRALVIDHLAGALASEPATVGGEPESPSPSDPVLAELRTAGFIEYMAPEGGPSEIGDLVPAGATVVLVSEGTGVLDYDDWTQPLVRALTEDGDGDGRPDVEVLAVEALNPDEGDNGDEGDSSLTERLRADDELSARLSTVNNIDTFAGRLAAVLAIQDLADGRTGHYGRGAQRLVPAPPR